MAFPGNERLIRWQMLAREPRKGLLEGLSRLLTEASAAELVQAAPVLGALIPELAPAVGFDQRSPHHAYDLFTHIACVVAEVPADRTLRWAALLHDVGKIPTFTQDETGRGHFYGHAEMSAEMADAVLRRLEAPEALREEAVLLIGNHMTRLPTEKDLLKDWLDRLGRETLEKLLILQEADMSSKGTGEPENMEQFVRLRELLKEIQSGQ